jgi:FkbM family methyltransferase
MNYVERSARWLKYSCGLEDSSSIIAAVRPFYDRFLEGLYGRQGLVRLMEGQESIRVRPAYRYYRDGHEAKLFHCLRRIVRPGHIVLEVGANVGIFTVLLARWLFPDGRVFAFEPTPLAKAALEDHLILNHIEEMVTIVPDALSDVPGQSRFYVEGTSGQNTLSVTHSRVPNAECISVSVDTLDAFCQANNIKPNLIKIDVEGFEYHVLRGSLQTLLSAAPFVVVEFHPMLWAEIGVTRSGMEEFLDRVQYNCTPITGQRDVYHEYGNVLLEPSRTATAL